MSEWTYLQIEHVIGSPPHCIFCNRPLKSGKALVVENADGERFYSGHACAQKNIGKPSERILDLSKIASSVVAATGDDKTSDDVSTEGKSTRKRAKPALDRLPSTDPVLRYLLLRGEHMPLFNGSMSKRLSLIYEHSSKTGVIEESDRKYISNLISKTKQDGSIYSMHNIERCIGFDYWLILGIDKTPEARREFLISMRKVLHENWRLTGGQLTAINRWGEGIRKVFPDFPTLEVSAFDSVVPHRYNKTQSKVS